MLDPTCVILGVLMLYNIGEVFEKKTKEKETTRERLKRERNLKSSNPFLLLPLQNKTRPPSS
jgi:hypothetical protein